MHLSATTAFCRSEPAPAQHLKTSQTPHFLPQHGPTRGCTCSGAPQSHIEPHDFPVSRSGRLAYVATVKCVCCGSAARIKTAIRTCMTTSQLTRCWEQRSMPSYLLLMTMVMDTVASYSGHVSPFTVAKYLQYKTTEGKARQKQRQCNCRWFGTRRCWGCDVRVRTDNFASWIMMTHLML